jgi:uncharacterized protein YjbI with pentapeptide repeats
MPPKRYSDEQIQKLRKRWTRPIINRIVRTCNEGGAIAELIAEIKADKDVPSLPDRMDLRGIDLSHQNLRGPWKIEEEKHVRTGVCLRGADLTGANLQWIILPRADLRDAILHDVNLANAELILSDLTGADLTGAELSGAWLLDTKFQKARVTKKQLQSRRNLGQLDFDYHAYEI